MWQRGELAWVTLCLAAGARYHIRHVVNEQGFVHEEYFNNKWTVHRRNSIKLLQSYTMHHLNKVYTKMVTPR